MYQTAHRVSIGVLLLLAFSGSCRTQAKQGTMPAALSGKDSQNGVSAISPHRADETELLTLIVAALRKGFDNEKEFCEVNKIAGNECDTAFRQIIKYVKVKLNPKGQEGVVVEIQGPGFCGSGGCSGYLLRRTTDGYENEGDASLGALEISGATTNAYYDLLFHGNKRYNAPDKVYTWDGSKYVERLQNADGSVYQLPGAATPAEQASNRKQWAIYIERLMADQAVGSTVEQYQKKNPNSCVTLQALTPMPGSAYSSCSNPSYTVVFESGHFVFWVSTPTDNDINKILKSIDDQLGKPSATSPDRWSWGLANAKNGTSLVKMSPQTFWEFDGNRAAIDRFVKYKAMQAKEEAQRKQLDPEESAFRANPAIKHHGLILGQPLITHNQDRISLKTDCLSEDDAYHNKEVEALIVQELNELKAGRRSSYCYWSARRDSSAPIDRIRRITVNTREKPRDVINDMTNLYGPPIGVRTASAEPIWSGGILIGSRPSKEPPHTFWQWKGANVAARTIFVTPIEAQDPQTLEKFFVTEIEYDLGGFQDLTGR